MTIQQILDEMRPVKPISRARLYIHLDRLGIKPLGARQRPQRYPDDTPDRIKRRLGIKIHVGANHLKRKGRR